MEAVKDEWDDVSDLTPYQMSSVNEWIEQFSERYDYVGKLVKDVSEKTDSLGDEDDDEETDAREPERDQSGEPRANQ